ncbi:MAG: methionyl-tRNA formyltransferase [Bacteroidales bacterium]|nr:methionyl-tRNA formyltransferase [Bacteroidales bacterium]
MKIVYFGTPEFAASQLEAILAAGYDVPAVVTTPDKPAGRGKQMHASEVKECALRHGLPVLQPEKLKDEAFVEQLRSYNADLFVVVAFRMLPEVIWSMPPKGTINLHASLLPQYRGAAPINHAIINGEKETGLTTFILDKEIDTGAMIMQEKIAIGDKMNAGELHDALMNLGNDVIVKTIKKIEEGKVEAMSQNSVIEKENLTLKPAPKVFKEDCYINWNKSGKEIYDFVRGLSPYPAAHAKIQNPEGEILDLKIFETELALKSEGNSDFLSIKTDQKTFLKVVLNDSCIKIIEIQQAGKKAMPIAEFLRGARISEDWKVVP